MYTLRMSPASPYARKVRMTVAAFGLQNQITMQATDTNDLADSLQSQIRWAAFRCSSRPRGFACTTAG